jgi:hypothetical protein
MRLTYQTARRWTACPASAADPPADWHEPASEFALEARAAQTAARMLVKREVSSADELAGRVIDGAEITEDAALMAGEFATRVIADGGQVENDLFCKAGAVWRMDCGWTLREPQADPQLVFAMALMQPCDQFTLTLFQPRPYHPAGRWRSWTLYGPQIEEWCKWLAERAEQANALNPSARPGEHCCGCPHRSRCQALREDCYAECEGQLGGERLPADALVAELARAERHVWAADARLSGLRAEAEARIRAGEWLPGWYVSSKEGRREFAVAAAAADLMLGVPTTKTVRRTPAEVERDGADKTVVARITRRPDAGPALTRLMETEARRLFKNR